MSAFPLPPRPKPAKLALEKSGEAEKIFLKWYGPGTKANFDKRSFKFETDEIDR